MEELKFNTETSKHILLLPGLLAPVYYLFPLVRYLRQNQTTYGVTAIPLKLSIASFDSIVERAEKIIIQNLLEKSKPQTIILFGHSHGGRVVCELVRRLKRLSPMTEYSVITAGSPFGKKLNYLPWLTKKFFSVSRSYREWLPIKQPDPSVVSRYIRLYSTDDRIVIPEMAKADYSGELIEFQGISHRELVSPKKIGPTLLGFLANPRKWFQKKP